MRWKAIGKSVTGAYHHLVEKGCEDALHWQMVTLDGGTEVMVVCAADGAGSAQYAKRAAEMATSGFVSALSELVLRRDFPTEADIYGIAENIYDALFAESERLDVPIQELSCTVLGCCVYPETAVFFQVGDGALVRNDGSGFFTPVWWPDNKEYQNVTSFLVDDPSLRDFKVCVIREVVNEVALFTDGLQLLALNFADETAFQPFFTGLFPHLRGASGPEQIEALESKLSLYLDSPAINVRTDDDKTLFLATRLR